jgi:hypothetical protein
MRQGAAGIVAENENLKKRLQEIASDREQLRSGAEQERERLRASAERLADHLGEAAKKPPGNAFATATSKSDGTASTENGSAPQAGSSSGTGPPAASVARPEDRAGATASSPRPAARAKATKQPRRRPPAPVAREARCDPIRALPADGARGPDPERDAACPPHPAAPPSAGAR